VGYSTHLEAKVARKVTKAIHDFNLIEDGDRVMVGLSGGKDSWALIQILDVLRKRAPISFSIIGVNIDSGYEDFQHGTIKGTCDARGWECHVEHTSIGEVMDDLLEADATPCSLCARLRRGVLYRIAEEVGATKIALGHHADDFIETLLINLFFAGATKAMPARLLSDNGRHVVVRPFVYVSEDEARLYTKEVGLPVIGCCCPVCGDLSLQRQRMKRLLLQLEREHPGVKASLLKALGNVMPRHLLDRRLNPPRAGGSQVPTAAAASPGPTGVSETAFAKDGEAAGVGEDGPYPAAEPGEGARIIPLMLRRATGAAAVGVSGVQASATPLVIGATREADTGTPAVE
jgi:tRNA 2-thiocytidine biosynthesis protein TtcA